MNNFFNQEKVESMYPEAGELMIPAMKIWELPKGKEETLIDYIYSQNYFAQEKIDGYFEQFVKTENHIYMFSRAVSEKTGLLTEKAEWVPHISNFLNEVLPANTILIGEIYIPGGTSKDITTFLGCLKEKGIERQKDTPLYYYVHDIIKYDGVNLINVRAELRYKILDKIWNKHNLSDCKYLRKADYFTEDLLEILDNILQSGGEGVVFKKKDSVYSPDKRPAKSTIKVKKHGDADVICVGFCDATKYYDGKLDLINNYGGKDADKWPYWVIEKMNLATGEILYEEKVEIGKQKCIREPYFRTVPVTKGYYYSWKTSMEIGAFNDQNELIKIGTVSSGLNDATKEEMSKNPEKYLRKVVKVGFMEKNMEDKTLRHPNFIELRQDKNSFECTLKEIFATK